MYFHRIFWVRKVNIDKVRWLLILIDIVNMENESLCVIVGGGIAGLSAADVLKKHGIRLVKS